jgi:hypothetical protein
VPMFGSMLAKHPRRRTGRWIALGAACAGALALAITLGVRASDDGAPAAPPARTVPRASHPPVQITSIPLAAAAPAAPAVPPQITVHVASVPPDATVLLDGVRLGKTPLTTVLPARPGAGWLKLRLPHRIPVRTQVSLDHDVDATVQLAPLVP